MFTSYKGEGSFVQHAYSIDYYRMRLRSTGETVQFTSFNGATSGFISDAFTFPETNHIIIILENSEQYNHYQMGPGIYQILQGEEVRLAKHPVEDILAKDAIGNGIEKAGDLAGREKELLALVKSGEYAEVKEIIHRAHMDDQEVSLLLIWIPRGVMRPMRKGLWKNWKKIRW